MQDDISIVITLDDVPASYEAEILKQLSDAVRESLEIAKDSLVAGSRNKLLADYMGSVDILMYDNFHGEMPILDENAEKLLLQQELGTPSWDIKAALLNSPKVKQGPQPKKFHRRRKFPKTQPTGNRYIVVPFHGNFGYNQMFWPNRQGYATAYAAAGDQKSFKTVSDKSRGWIYPAQPAEPIFEDAKAAAREFLEERVEEILGDLE